MKKSKSPDNFLNVISIRNGRMQKNTNIDKNSDTQDSISMPQTPEKKDWRYFWRRVIADFTNRDLVPVKILFFFKYAIITTAGSSFVFMIFIALFVLYPFITLHMAELGLNEWEIGVNQATAPFIAILGPPFVGIIADRIGNFKILLSFLTLVNAGMALLLLLVPTARETITLPAFITFELKCDNNSEHFILHSIDNNECTLNYSSTDDHPSWRNLAPSSIRCGYVCPSSLEQGITIKPYTKFEELDFQQINKTMSYREQSGFIQFIENEQPELACTQGDPVQEHCSLSYRTNFDGARNLNATSIIAIQNLTLIGGAPFIGKEHINVTELRMEISKFSLNGIEYDEVVCNEENDKVNETLLPSEKECTRKCFVQYDRNIFCSNVKERKVYNVALTFAVYTGVRILLGFASATSFIMFEGAVLAIMKQYGGDYGLQRVFATLAAIIVSPLSGQILKSFGFYPVIWGYALLQAISALLTLAIDLEFKKPAEKVIRNLKEVLSKVEILIFFLAMLYCGTLWGYLETFLFLYLEQMGGSRFLMGLTISIGGIAGLPLLIFSRPIIKRFGHVNCLCLGLLFYCIRFIGYSIITDPWQCLIFEALEAITVSLALTAASTYAVALSNLQTIASIQGLFGCLYFGVGRGMGAMLGGILIKNIGHVETFRVFGLGSLIGAILYLLINLLYLRKHSIAHTGLALDINNLNLHEKEDNKNAEAESQAKKDEDLELQKDKGYIGPLAMSKFTDVPLDEEVH